MTIRERSYLPFTSAQFIMRDQSKRISKASDPLFHEQQETTIDEKPAELAPNHSLHYASTEPANAAPKPKPELKSQKEATGLEANAPLLNKHYSGYAGEAEVGSHTQATPTAKPTLSSSKKSASVGYASTEVKESVPTKPALSSEANAKKPASVGYASTEVKESVPTKPALSSEANAKKPASVGYAADAVTNEEPAPKPELSSSKKSDKISGRPSVPKPQESPKGSASIEKPVEDTTPSEAARRPSVPRRQGSMAYETPKVRT